MNIFFVLNLKMDGCNTMFPFGMALFQGRFVRFRECTPWKMNILNLKIICLKRKTSEPNLHFWIQDVHFPGV